ncbi:ABC transporter permease subunit [Nocardioides sp.]|uniref:ABC transporter permease n=1 Tax=Nocardioides sp. TaxID=35761 RepID=UPI00262BE240|nr:ABC transporter permease subunit [Nocardioides sp.]MDI6909533.1 ABC transporter permease subunit [Nocardioides sp.]
MSTAADRRTVRHLPLALVLAMLWAPWVPLVLRAFTDSWRFPAVLPERMTLRGFRTIAAPDSGVFEGLVLSLEIGIAVSALACLVGWPAGRALGTYQFRGRRAVQALLLTPVIVPALAAAMGLQILFVRLGLAGSPPGVMLVQLIPAVPYATSILAAGFANLDLDYETQARVLGARGPRRLLAVTIPLMRGPLVAAAVMAFLISWSDFLLALLIGAGQVKTLPVQLFAAVTATDTTVAAAVALTMVAPALLVMAAAAGPLARLSQANLGKGPL